MDLEITKKPEWSNEEIKAEIEAEQAAEEDQK